MTKVISKTIQAPNPEYVAALEEDARRMLQALVSIRYMNNGPDKGSAQWQLDTAVSIAENTILACENSRVGKTSNTPEVLQGIKDGRFIEEARRILNAITDTLNTLNPVDRGPTATLDVRVTHLVRILETVRNRYGEALKRIDQLSLELKDRNEEIADLKQEVSDYQVHLREDDELIAKYESIFQDIGTLTKKVT